MLTCISYCTHRTITCQEKHLLYVITYNISILWDPVFKIVLQTGFVVSPATGNIPLHEFQEEVDNSFWDRVAFVVFNRL